MGQYIFGKAASALCWDRPGRRIPPHLLTSTLKGSLHSAQCLRDSSQAGGIKEDFLWERYHHSSQYWKEQQEAAYHYRHRIQSLSVIPYSHNKSYMKPKGKHITAIIII